MNGKKRYWWELFVLITTLFMMSISANAADCAHEWGEWEKYNYNNCEEDTECWRFCENCGEMQEKVIPAKGHRWSSWKTIEYPTCSEEGLKERICSECGESEYEDIPQTGKHSWGSWEVVEEPDCYTVGEAQRECFDCSEIEFKALAVDPSAHDWSDWYEADDATVFHAGTLERECNNCYKIETKTTAKLPAKIALNKKSVKINAGSKYRLKIKKKANGDSVKKWSSKNKRIASVNKKGVITAKRKGTTYITVTMKSGVKAKCKVTVKKAPKKKNSKKSSKKSSNKSSGSGSGQVWISTYGTKYHKYASCSNMRKPWKVSVSYAKSKGRKPCKKCF